ncbi:unnamed protein product [Caretta caretta]
MAALQSLGPVAQFPIDLHSPRDAGQSQGAKTTEPRDMGRTQTSAGRDSSNMSLENLCPIKRCLLLLGAIGLLAGAAIGMWLLETPGKTSPLSPRLPREVEGRPGWLLACHERWNLSLGTLICRQLGYLQLAHHKGVNLTDVKVNDTQEFVQIVLNQKNSIEDMWQVRSSCASGRIVALKCSECGMRSRAARIVGGSDAPLGRWPWQVSLYLNSKHVCGGSVVARDWIVTAAHCVHNYRQPQVSSWLVFAGMIAHVSVQQQAGAAVEKIIYHPRYDDRSHDYDIALMKLTTPLNFSDAIRAVCLPLYRQDFPRGTHCWISGWGYTRPEHVHIAEMLKEAIVPLISTKKCNSSCMYSGELTPRMLCAGYLDGKVDACQGDSGGPLVCQDELTWRLVGIVSWGTGCAEPNYPGVYTKVAEFLDWIYHIIESH